LALTQGHYESPFTDFTPQGPDGLFTSPRIDEEILRRKADPLRHEARCGIALQPAHEGDH
jgi:hypothetical protein